ncbi:putative E3 ubiquitin-protein ligase SMURF2 [Blattamonas nauphoetae]|uniref:HECT-type E3 ubiquitin transferase n=1 Tax=Blattamonas nauphoetae TaxID=2049346 RepID=A0ABQ9YJK0_9EUKA|nr:putative E3 ubiquitin-protein ligase SMURF2 [Blattamonas nauphoetae]
MTDSIQVPVGYSFVRIINTGGFGTVVEMIEKSTKKHYAGKIVQCLTQKHKDRFDREVGRLKTFSHPRITKLKESVTMESDRVMVMELGGKSLADVVRDYSERNILMPRGVCDFGAAELEDDSSSQSVMSQLYVSPERMESETGKATCKADVWSLGVVLYWLLFGEPPFKAKNPVQLIRAISSFKATSIKNTCGDEERALLMRMMDPVCLLPAIDHPSLSFFLFSFDQCAESRVTSRQLYRGKAFRCIVNTIEGVWKLNDEERTKREKEVEGKQKAERERRKMEEEKKKAESERARMEEEKKKAESERARMEEEKKKAETERLSAEEKVRRLETKLKTITSEKATVEKNLTERTQTLLRLKEQQTIRLNPDSLQNWMKSHSTPLTSRQKEFVKALHSIQPFVQNVNRRITVPHDVSIEGTMEAFSALTVDQLRESFYVMIEGTSAIDLNGVKRWCFTNLVERLMDPDDQHLFVVDGHSDGRMMIANDSQTRSPEFLEKYRFVGVVLGKMLLEGIPVPFRFNEFIWKQLQGYPTVSLDLSFVNPNLASGLSELLSFSDDELTELELHWTTTLPDGTSTELIPEGETKILCHSDLALFHELAAGAVLQWYSPQLMAMRAGLTSLVPQDVLRMLSPTELEITVCGEDTIDVEKWKQATKNSDPLRTQHPVTNAFWQVMETSTDDVRKAILRLQCGRTSLSILQQNGKPTFTLNLLHSKGPFMPIGNMCIQRLDLPDVSDVDVMRTLILLAIKKRALPND